MWPVYLLITLAICVVVYRRQERQTFFWRWLFPKSIDLHASNMVDLKVFLLDRACAALELFNLVVLSSFVALTIVDTFGSGDGGASPLPPVVIAILFYCWL